MQKIPLSAWRILSSQRSRYLPGSKSGSEARNLSILQRAPRPDLRTYEHVIPSITTCYGYPLVQYNQEVQKVRGEQYVCMHHVPNDT